jgi:TfoX/Sxy family transcriptional regulator of competence genes
MSYDEKAAERARKALSGRRGMSEKKMFGGIAFMLNGAMCCGVLKDDLVVRVGAALNAKALAQPHTRPFDFTGKPMAGIVYVAPAGYRSGAALGKWIRWGAAAAGGEESEEDRKKTPLTRGAR